MDKAKKKLGFGCMRLPMIGKEVDIPQFTRMVDRFIEEGFNYFDTAHCYIDGKSETAIRECITSRYPRDKYVLTDKLTDFYFNSQEEIRPFFEEQLKWCGVEYFDFYLMHAQNGGNYEKFRKCRAYETAFELKAEGKIRHVGLSFHDSAEVLERILTDYPEVEIVQIQFNYLDYDDPSVQSRKVYDVCRKFGKPILVMEPVKGGRLADMPKAAADALTALGGGSPASYAVRFAAGFEGMYMVLSGMSNIQQLEDNIGFMKDFTPLDDTELDAVHRAVDILRSKDFIPCTACRYCVPGCPMKISIPELFSCMNTKRLTGGSDAGADYAELTRKRGKASSCIKCGRCENACPQHLPIRDLLIQTAETFEK